ncbi:MAG TPA: large-conductance mechanosensitive channel protein MscL [Bacteroidia bacterium]|nr:large-conductance mechanosensitive channel protein MscL [Bacteroidia bacterium]
MGIIKEFKEFAVKGNAIDLAVGVVIGAAFGKIVTSIVSDVLMPPIGLLMGGVNFTDIKWTMKDAIIDATGKILKPAVTLNVGNFLQAVVDFTIVAFSVFLLVKAINSMSKKKDEAPAAPTPQPAQEVLLTEIRDLLKNKN